MDHDPRSSAARTVAVVDDEERVLVATASLVRSLGYRCVCFTSADAADADALAAVDCVCSDVQMPGASGLDLARRLGGSEGSPPVILMTAFSTPEVVAESARIGVSALLEKPLDADVLERALARAIGPGPGRVR